MVPVRDKTVIQIEVTNACERECTNFAFYFMKLDQVEKAIDSLLDFPGGIGVMGGEPLMHPHFEELAALES